MKKWYESSRKDLWFLILFNNDKLKWREDFLEEKRVNKKPYQEHINESLLSAAKSMQSASPGELVAISQLLHTASSVVLLESERKQVDATLNFIQDIDHFHKIDPSVVLTSIALYYLIRSVEDIYKEDNNKREMVEHIHTRLDQMNWFIGSDGMRVLGIRPLQSS